MLNGALQLVVEPLQQDVAQEEESCEYIRVATDYYRILNGKPGSPINSQFLRKWKLSTIKDDYDDETYRSIKRGMPKYKDFVVFPNHLNYKREVNGYYNKYEPITHTPFPGSVEVTMKFLHHIFGEQLPIGLDYLQLLFTKPEEKLYILCLVSKERGTGKSTFFKWVNRIFGANFTYVNASDLEGRFNSDWSEKLIIAVDETFINQKGTVERIKNLSTAESFKTEEKQKDKIESKFFAKFMFASNNDDSFLPIDEKENRFWVINVPVLKQDNTNILDDLSKEIPAFLHYLLERKDMHTPFKKTRMWHDQTDIWTPALEKAIDGSRSDLEKELKHLLKEEFLEIRSELLKRGEEDCLKLTLGKDIMPLIRKSFHKVSEKEVSKILQINWKLEPKPNGLSYKKWRWDSFDKPQFDYTNEKGRYYTFTPDVLGL